jgi:hypothetical protein
VACAKNLRKAERSAAAAQRRQAAEANKRKYGGPNEPLEKQVWWGRGWDMSGVACKQEP